MTGDLIKEGIWTQKDRDTSRKCQVMIKAEIGVIHVHIKTLRTAENH